MTKPREHHTPGGIRFRAIEPEDLPDLKRWRNEQKKYYREYRFINTPHQEDWFTGMSNDRGHMHYAIDVWDNRWLLVGSCNWSNIDWVHRHAELGIYIGDSEWRGKGVGLKAMIELHKIAFHELNMETVRLEVFSFNRAVKFYDDFGYKRVGAWRNAHFYDRDFTDSILMDMTNTEWEELWNERYSNFGKPDITK